MAHLAPIYTHRAESRVALLPAAPAAAVCGTAMTALAAIKAKRPWTVRKAVGVVINCLALPVLSGRSLAECTRLCVVTGLLKLVDRGRYVQQCDVTVWP